MTLFGVFFLVICVIAFCYRIKYSIYLVIFSCIFQAAAVININEKGFSPLLISELFFLFKCFVLKFYINDKSCFHLFLNRQNLLLVFFVIFVIIQTIIVSHSFSNLRVIVPGVTGDNELIQGNIVSNLHFTMKNVIQFFYLIINVMTVICISDNASKINLKSLQKLFVYSIMTVVLIGFWEFLAKMTHIISFPDSFFYSNSGYAQLWLQNEGDKMRLNSTFIEPSFAGSFLVSSLGAVYYMTIERRYFYLSVLLVAVLLNFSGTGFLTLIIVCFFIFCSISLKSKIKVILYASICGIIIYAIGYYDLIFDFLINKNETQSGLARAAAMQHTFSLIIDSYGMGVGLGSNRDLNLFTGLVASVGIIGSVLFYLYIGKLLCKIYKYDRLLSNKYIIVFAISCLVSQWIAISDFSYSIMWMWLFVATIIRNHLVNNQKTDFVINVC